MIRASLFSTALTVLFFAVTAYVGLLATLLIPAVQVQVIYLHSITLTWFQDVDNPVQWGFLPNQVSTFFLNTSDGEKLHTWHILPSVLYQKHESDLVAGPSGPAPDPNQTLAFKLLRDDPDALLVLYFHGAAGTLGSGWRPPSYRAMHALAPSRIHTVAIDYRGFGKSTGAPTEPGLLEDAKTLVRWALEEARIPPERIVLFAQSMGTAVTLSLAHDLAVVAPQPVLFRGIVLVAPFADAAELTSTYSIAGILPLLGPLAAVPPLHAFFKRWLICKWPTKEYLADFIKAVEGWRRDGARYDISIIHAMDDWDIPWSHSEMLFWHAVERNSEGAGGFEIEREKIMKGKKALGDGGWAMERKSRHGILRQEIVEYGLHDRIMSYPIVSRAILRAFGGYNELDGDSREKA